MNDTHDDRRLLEAGQIAFKRDFHRLIGDKQNDFVVGYVAGYAAASPVWVKVSERLPRSTEMVLCQLRESGRLVCNSWARGCDQNEAWFADRFIAWMPLPEPYTEDKEDGE
jgi:hypothetical protein